MDYRATVRTPVLSDRKAASSDHRVVGPEIPYLYGLQENGPDTRAVRPESP